MNIILLPDAKTYTVFRKILLIKYSKNEIVPKIYRNLHL